MLSLISICSTIVYTDTTVYFEYLKTIWIRVSNVVKKMVFSTKYDWSTSIISVEHYMPDFDVNNSKNDKFLQYTLYDKIGNSNLDVIGIYIIPTCKETLSQTASLHALYWLI